MTDDSLYYSTPIARDTETETDTNTGTDTYTGTDTDTGTDTSRFRRRTLSGEF